MYYMLLILLAVAKFVAPQYMIEPPPRRIGNNTSVRLNCGGLEVLRSSGGRCGTCGEPWFNISKDQGPIIPSRIYAPNSFINVTVYLGRFRPGWFEFRICRQPVNYALTQDCFDRLILNIVDVNSTRIYLKPSDFINGTYSVRLYIPNHVSCNYCVLQWKYQTSDSLGKDRYDNMECVGCGIQQVFKDCAYIRIRGKNKLLLNRAYLRDQINSYPIRRRLLRNQPPNNPLSLSSRIFPQEPKPVVTHDRVCMSKVEYDQFRETVNLLEYLVHRLKHESLRELTVQRDVDENIENSATPSGTKSQFYQTPSKLHSEFKKPMRNNSFISSRKQPSRRDFTNNKNSRRDIFCKANRHKGFCPKNICRC